MEPPRKTYVQPYARFSRYPFLRAFLRKRVNRSAQLKPQSRGYVLPLFGVFIYLMFYIYTSGRGMFAANGGWGDLEKTHELTAVLLFGCIWLLQNIFKNPSNEYSLALYAACITNVIIGFASGFLCGLFLGVVWLYALASKNKAAARISFIAGVVTVATMLVVMLINYLATGLPQDQLAHIVWPWIDWHKVVKLGYTLELYLHREELVRLDGQSLPLLQSLSKMFFEYYRLYMLWPFAVVAVALYCTRRKFIKPEGMVVLLCFVLAGYALAVFGGGRSQFISFFRFSTFNYAPILIVILLIGGVAVASHVKWAIRAALVSMAALAVYGATVRPEENNAVTFSTWAEFKTAQWGELFKAAYAYNSGEVSLYDAVRNQRGRVGRMKWGGIHPSMRHLYNADALPPKTRVWSLYNHSYCLLPDCNVQQYFSQVTSPRWYDIALGSVEDGKKIMQSEGLNLFFYSRNINTVVGSDTKDMLAGFYKGMSPEYIDKTFGILWTNGWDYLLTWKENSVAPLDDGFMDSWRSYYESSVVPRMQKYPMAKLAAMVKKAVEDKNVTHPPLPEW